MNALKVNSKSTTSESFAQRLHRACSYLLLVACAFSAWLLPSSMGQAQETNPPGTSQPTPEATAALSFDRTQYLAAFEQVWQTIRDTHWDAKLVESVWLPARDKYLPQIEAAQSRDEAVQVLKKIT